MEKRKTLANFLEVCVCGKNNGGGGYGLGPKYPSHLMAGTMRPLSVTKSTPRSSPNGQMDQTRAQEQRHVQQSISSRPAKCGAKKLDGQKMKISNSVRKENLASPFENMKYLRYASKNRRNVVFICDPTITFGETRL